MPMNEGNEPAEYDCSDVHYENQGTDFTEGVHTPETPEQREQYGISHVDVYVRAFDTDRYGTGDDCVKDAGEPVS